MKFFWVNNVASIVGGTLQATHSMVRALPDCEHVVFTFSKTATEECLQAFEGVAMESGLSVVDAIRKHQPDVIIYQNTPYHRMPRAVPDHTLQVYYQHSLRDNPGPCWKQCDVTLSVSKFLARELGMDESTVLYQPVTIPERGDRKFKHGGGPLIVRIASPSPKKWRAADWKPHAKAVVQHTGGKIATVGWPKSVERDMWADKYGTAYDPTLANRSILTSADILLYTSSTVESFGRTVREAQRCGCVPIVSRSGGFVEQIENEDGPDYGFLIETPDDAVQAVSEYLKSPSWWAEHVKKRGEAEGSLMVWRQRFLDRLLEV